MLKDSDPSSWLRNVGGHVAAIIALSFVAAANFGTSIADIYASTIGLRNFRRLEKLPWLVVLLMTIMPVAFLGMFVPELVFNRFGTILALVGVCFAPLCGIQIADYFVLRRGHIDVPAIYETHPGSRYYFLGGLQSRRRGRSLLRHRPLRLSSQPAHLRVARTLPVPDSLTADGAGFSAGLRRDHTPRSHEGGARGLCTAH